jgi:hypothetical protein
MGNFGNLSRWGLAFRVSPLLKLALSEDWILTLADSPDRRTDLMSLLRRPALPNSFLLFRGCSSPQLSRSRRWPHHVSVRGGFPRSR